VQGSTEGKRSSAVTRADKEGVYRSCRMCCQSGSIYHGVDDREGETVGDAARNPRNDCPELSHYNRRDHYCSVQVPQRFDLKPLSVEAIVTTAAVSVFSLAIISPRTPPNPARRE
jgi:hypothetical protein